MGCSYDPVPNTIYPSPAELWMEQNGFSELDVAAFRGGRTNVSSCHECGLLLSGTRYGLHFLILHLPICPVKPREMIKMKTEEECKNYPRTVYR